MRWKITNRFLASIIAIVIIVFFVNTIITISYFYLRSSPSSESTSPETFTRNFEKYITVNGQNINVSETGKKQLDNKQAFIQVLDDGGKELYRYNAPKELPSSYTPTQLIHYYKYIVIPKTSLFFSEKDSVSYVIGMQNTNTQRYIFTFNAQDLFGVASRGIVIFLLVDILIAIIVGLFFGQKLTKPLHALIEGIHSLRQRSFQKIPVKKGVYKKVFDNVNDLASTLDAYEKQQQQNEKIRNEWISNISHDMKTPLASIRGYAELLNETPTKEEIEKYSRIIETKAIYMDELLNDLNLTMKLRNHALPLQKQTTSLNSFSREMIIQLLNDDATNQRQLSFEPSANEITVEIDQKLMRRAIINLIDNAFIHNDDDVQVDVSLYDSYPQTLREQNEKLSTIPGPCMIIQDNGKGILPQDLDNIFERYYRGTNTQNTRGTGLGMAIARDIIEAQGGHVTLLSDGHSGTTIVIHFKK
ncbi:sensor histidine kinase [Kurthia senegalensis]|uniref:sensor histidine kinase n=1 Tax=Kurthia senegalensis TaxID=1033740 RepID=UPI00028936C2|nr:HAMP domain-containing sensor histidine kinase [Kurthia senegalensis]